VISNQNKDPFHFDENVERKYSESRRWARMGNRNGRTFNKSWQPQNLPSTI
jgi:hypothetical protein